MSNAFDPKEDGLTHLNVYSRAQTALGKALSNFSKLSLEHPIHGWFHSMEGYWYYATTGFRHEDLRTVSGYDAKKLGRCYPRVTMDEETFKHHIRCALDARFSAHPWLRDALADSTLPLTHYYYYGHIDNPKVVVPAGGWVIDHLEYCRQRFQNKQY